MPVCPRCKGANLKQMSDPLYMECPDCGKTFMLSKVKVKILKR